MGITIGPLPDGNLWFTEAGFGVHKIGSYDFVADHFDEFSIPSGGTPQDITLGPDEHLWFTEVDVDGVAGNDKIARMSSAGVVTGEFTIPTPNSQPFGITAGPGGLWFTEINGNKIGRITTDGVITEFPIPTPGAQPFYITVGPDGNIWFTEFNANQIGRLVPPPL